MISVITESDLVYVTLFAYCDTCAQIRAKDEGDLKGLNEDIGSDTTTILKNINNALKTLGLSEATGASSPVSELSGGAALSSPAWALVLVQLLVLGLIG
jgi:hypothetical protein